MNAGEVGSLVKQWRARRSLSQLALAIDVGVSPKHLSFVETGRSRPSPELIMAIGEHLQVPLRERNTMLLAAGFAPRFTRTPIDDPSMRHVDGALRRLLDAHDPYPGVVLDGQWNVVLANRSATALVASLPLTLTSPLNMFRAGLHPDGLAAITTNFDEWGTYLLGQLGRLAAITADPSLVELNREVNDYPNVIELRARTAWTTATSAVPLLVPCSLRVGGVDLSMFSTLTTFGTPRDITLDELAVELFFPADAPTEQALRGAEPSNQPAA